MISSMLVGAKNLLFVLDNESIFFDNVRNLFAIIDRIVYYLISVFYNVLVDLANLQIIENLKLDEFSARVYGFIGIVMLFKLSFSLIQYIIDPDKISDSKIGAGTFVKNVLITFLLIVIVPFAFDRLYEIQSAILEDAVIPKLILGVKSNGSTTDYSKKKISIVMDDEYCKDNNGKLIATKTDGIGDFVALATFRPFFQIDDDHSSIYFDSIKDSYCKKAKSVGALLKNPNVYKAPYLMGTSGETYVVDYQILMSTIIGGVVALLFLGFCFDTAMRNIKLLFLEIIAPVAIISFVDPNSGQSGLFKKWFDEVKNTWLSLFIRLAAVYFAIYVITLFNINNNINNWLMLFVIIGALMFAKQLPGLIENMVGIKATGAFTLNPLKKIENEALFGQQIAQLPSRVATGTASMVTSAAGAIGGSVLARRQFNREQNALNYRIADRLRTDRERINQIRAERQAIERQRDEELSNAIFTSDYDEANQRYQERIAAHNRQFGIENDDADQTQFNQMLQNQEDEMNAAVSEMRDQMNENANKYNEKWSNRHSVLAGLAQVSRGTRLGFQNGTNLNQIVNNTLNSAIQAASLRNDHDVRSLRRRAEDLVTDVTGVKNDSGTTSLIKRDIKQQNEHLSDIRNYISQLNESLGRWTTEGGITYANGRPQTIEGFDYLGASNGRMDRGDVDRIIEELRHLREDEIATNRRLNELQDSARLSARNSNNR